MKYMILAAVMMFAACTGREAVDPNKAAIKIEGGDTFQITNPEFVEADPHVSFKLAPTYESTTIIRLHHVYLDTPSPFSLISFADPNVTGEVGIRVNDCNELEIVYHDCIPQEGTNIVLNACRGSAQVVVDQESTKTEIKDEPSWYQEPGSIMMYSVDPNIMSDDFATIGFSSYVCTLCNKDLGRLAEYATYHVCGAETVPLYQRFLDSIPTEPNYFEMPRNLMIVWPDDDPNSIYDPTIIRIWKGTRIYFTKELK